jgi:hypothetical protein
MTPCVWYLLANQGGGVLGITTVSRSHRRTDGFRASAVAGEGAAGRKNAFTRPGRPAPQAGALFGS